MENTYSYISEVKVITFKNHILLASGKKIAELVNVNVEFMQGFLICIKMTGYDLYVAKDNILNFIV